jgi:hypothetical protein
LAARPVKGWEMPAFQQQIAGDFALGARQTAAQPIKNALPAVYDFGQLSQA